MNYKELEDAFRSSGFVNITLIPQDTLISSSADNVISIEIDIPGGGTYKDYNSANKFSLDSEVIITYSHYATSEPEVSTPEPQETPEAAPVFELDTLQNGFISISENTTIDDILSFVEEHSLFYSENEVTIDKTVYFKIAYEEGVTPPRYADSGDYLEVSFDRATGDTIQYAQYVNSNIYDRSALFYNYGTWYHFSGQNADDYSGYYLIKSDVHSSFDAEGIVIKSLSRN